MRLKDKELSAIIEAFRPLLESLKGNLYLFGSRLDDAKKGGDIDLLVIVPAKDIERIQQAKVLLIDQIHAKIGEQRIDVTISSPARFAEDEFLSSLKTAQLI